ncbi:MAG: transaldolase family protein, partial [Candidatus Deferrimicrobiaceae bacterium]
CWTAVQSDPEFWGEWIAKQSQANPGLDNHKLAWLTYKEVVRRGAEMFMPIYEASHGRFGWISGQLDPRLFTEVDQMVTDADELRAISPNVMIKVPATPEGVPAIRTLLTEGINVNVTLLFAKEAYEGVAQAFVEAIEARVAKGLPVDKVASVASFFVSRIDSAVDALLEEKMKTATGQDKARMLRPLGKVAIANAKVAYQSYKKTFSGPRWEPLALKNAQTQRVLWASTGTKNPKYSDVLYVEELIGPRTVNTMPLATIDAFRDHGKVADTLTGREKEAREVLDDLGLLDIGIEEVCEALVRDGVQSFTDSYQKLLGAIERKLSEAKVA